MNGINKFLFTLLILSSFTLSRAQEDEINQLDENGNKTGFWQKQYENGKLMYEGYFADNKPVGIMKRYFPEGGLSAEIRFLKDGTTSYATMYYTNGKKAAEGKFIYQQKDSTWNYYSFYNQRLAIMEEWKDGQKDGVTKKFYDNGSIAEITGWKNGMQHGTWIQYYENGALRLKSFFENGRQNGPFESYTADGKPFISGNYLNDKMHGTWIYHSSEENPEMRVEYKSGTMLPNQEMKKRQEDFSKEVEKIIGKFPEPIEDNMR
ncbi:MAG: toxin-antitoxin system YwqK family antitoxin [Bacteroidales bacterium]|nr:toxin-antitoxin system YwqK family antitoxin [Bacteroidales bacterium]